MAAGGEPGPGYFASDNVEFVTNIPLHQDSAGGRKVGRYFYITTSRDLTIYDIADPVNPQRVGSLPVGQQPVFRKRTSIPTATSC